MVLAAMLGIAFSSAAMAQLKVDKPWVRPTVAQQSATGAFMMLTATAPVRVIGVSSPVAGHAELHEMRMEGNVMRMRAVPGIDVTPAQSVELKPGGYHVMLFELKREIKEGEKLPLVLEFEDAAKKKSTLEVEAVARMVGTSAQHMKH